MRIRLDSIGCRLNIGEMDSLARGLAAGGHRIVGPGEDAELVVFNTCAVTSMASRKSRKVLRQFRRRLPEARIVATGCHAELSPDATRALGVDMVVANSDKDRLASILAEAGFLESGEPVVEQDAASFLSAAGAGHTRAFLKVQDGCDNRCTFCIVTVARGEGRSRDANEIVGEVRGLVDLGYREAVLTGVHLGSYGHDRGERRALGELVRRILGETDLARLRLSSLEPWDLDPDFFANWSDPRLLPHLHLPLQSGCNATLTRMARHTNQSEFASLLEQARSAIPEVAISTDVIVGFPGEGPLEFQESLDFVAAMQFSRLHVFRYSPRAGTAAASMSGQVDSAALGERSARMHALGAELERAFQVSQLQCTRDVLWESSEPYGDGLRWSGLSGNYVRVVTETRADVDLRNVIEPTRLVGVSPGAMLGISASTFGGDPSIFGGHPTLQSSSLVTPS